VMDECCKSPYFAHTVAPGCESRADSFACRGTYVQNRALPCYRARDGPNHTTDDTFTEVLIHKETSGPRALETAHLRHHTLVGSQAS